MGHLIIQPFLCLFYLSLISQAEELHYGKLLEAVRQDQQYQNLETPISFIQIVKGGLVFTIGKPVKKNSIM